MSRIVSSSVRSFDVAPRSQSTNDENFGARSPVQFDRSPASFDERSLNLDSSSRNSNAFTHAPTLPVGG